MHNNGKFVTIIPRVLTPVGGVKPGSCEFSSNNSLDLPVLGVHSFSHSGSCGRPCAHLRVRLGDVRQLGKEVGFNLIRVSLEHLSHLIEMATLLIGAGCFGVLLRMHITTTCFLEPAALEETFRSVGVIRQPFSPLAREGFGCTSRECLSSFDKSIFPLPHLVVRYRPGIFSEEKRATDRNFSEPSSSLECNLSLCVALAGEHPRASALVLFLGRKCTTDIFPVSIQSCLADSVAKRGASEVNSQTSI
jgi:hypothetical protein